MTGEKEPWRLTHLPWWRGAWLRKANFGHSQYGAQDRGTLAGWGLTAVLTSQAVKAL